MNQKLQQAIVAARSGDNKKAQYLLSQSLQEDPENTQAWYLLSLLVDSEEKQITYLNRALAIDPNHEKAQEKLAALTTAVSPTPTFSPADTNLAEQESSESLPDWMSDDLPDNSYAETWIDSETDQTDLVEDDANELPDWLQESVLDEWEQEEKETPKPAAEESQMLVDIFADTEDEEQPAAQTAVAETKPKPGPKPTPTGKKQPTPQKKTQGSQMNLILGALIVLSVLVGLFLIYLLVTM
ncbi:MAG: hypothetical protein IPF56_18165 [Chloroflexi bacterium]|nr:hypothetical protein [Chloroflexota bacterium]MBK6713128.1 hypothetical protein [Chloroflexota bacterium]MBP7591792.1 hypothetical protein [Chloroflexota bacterium]